MIRDLMVTVQCVIIHSINPQHSLEVLVVIELF